MNDATKDLFGDPDVSQQDRLRTQLAAVELLLARTDRDVAHHDILLATIFEILEDGPRAQHELVSRVGETWPFMHLLLSQVESALRIASETNHIQPVADEEGPVTYWQLLDAGRIQLNFSRERASDLQKRFEHQIKDELQERDWPGRPGELGSLIAVVIGSIRYGVSQCFRSAATDRLEEVDGWLRVVGTDTRDLADYIDNRVFDVERADLIKALVLLAFDHSTALGSEVVHHLVTGHLLYAFMTRPDRSAAATAAGTLRGEIIYLDTPFLLRLTAPALQRKPVLDLLAAAKAAGIDIVLLRRTRLEFEHTLDTTAQHEVPAISEALKRSDLQVLASLQRQRTAIHNWLQWAAEQASRDQSWDRWRAELNGPSGILATLRALGVKVDEDPAWPDLDAVDMLARFKNQLTHQLGQEGVRSRPTRVIEHDARNLVEVYLARRQNPPSQAKVWPGAFILTPDAQLNATYEAAAGTQAFPAALTFSQAAQIIGAYGDPRASEQFAFDVAGGVAEQVLLARAVVVSADLARNLAIAVGTEPVTRSEVEQLQLDLRRAFEVSRDQLEAGSPEDDQLVAEVTQHMRERRQAIRVEERRASADEERRRAIVDERRAAELRASRSEAQRLGDSAARIAEEKQRIEESETAAQAKIVRLQQEARRSRLVERSAYLLSLIAIVLLFAGQALPSLAALLSAASALAYGKEWVKGRTGVGVAAFGAVAFVVGVLSLLVA